MTLLIKEPTIIILPTLAIKFGMVEAFFLQQLHYKSRFSQTVVEGYKWYRCTIDNWLMQMPFLSRRTLQRTIQSLNKQHLVERMCFDGQGTCYRIRYDVLYELLVVDNAPNGHVCQIGSNSAPNCHTSMRQSGISGMPDWHTEMDKNTDIATVGGALRSKERNKEKIIKECHDVLLYVKAVGGQWGVDEGQVFQAVYDKLKNGADVVNMLTQVRKACQQQLTLYPHELFGDDHA